MNKSKIFKKVILICSIFGLFLHIKPFTAQFTGNIFWYFTVQSNILIFCYYLSVWAHHSIETPKMLRIKGYIVLPILLTGVLNWFILIPVVLKLYGNVYPLLLPSNFFVHGLIPVLVLLDSAFIDHCFVYRKYDPFAWALFPLGYGLLIYLRAVVGHPIFENSSYPYPFFDPKIMGGWNHVVMVLTGIAIIYVGTGYFLYFWKKYQAHHR